MSLPQRIIVTRFSAMGDVAMVASVLKEFCIRYPDVEIIMVSRPFFSPFFDGIKKAFFNYILASFKICLMITLFYLLIDEGFLKLIVYIICCLVLLSFNLKDVKRNIDSIKTNAKRIKQKIW